MKNLTENYLRQPIGEQLAFFYAQRNQVRKDTPLFSWIFRRSKKQPIDDRYAAVSTSSC